ncbi:hypothetical protein BJ508DRAFT_410087 [Ascobolus immersus RN42]|uniref:Protein CFT1 n=1 Tax=Ascobolus immersus RN42 TaxID=1160509 RepID=A0A3N4IVB1_ASCIM|nr:hypothetical protein BJ508DRAFT_410087 [Ascobolus immersus RN42]
MPEIYTELTQPTAVNTAIRLPFLSPNDDNLIIAKSTLLQIFRLVAYEDTSSVKPEADENIPAVPQGDGDQSLLGTEINIQRAPSKLTKLVLVGEYPLSGNVISLARVKPLTSKSGGDCLLIATKEAKVSLVEWDPSTNNLTTISIHYYEREEFKSSVTPESTVNYLTSDPGNRCVVLKFNFDMLAIIPFRQKEDEYLALEDDDEDMYDADSGEKTSPSMRKASDARPAGPERPYQPSFVVSAAQLDEAILHVVSISFLYEYREPTFGILYRQQQTTVGLLDSGRRDNVHYIIITLDLEQRASTPIISVPELPYDTFKIVPLRPPIGGSLLLGTNQLIHVDQAGKTIGVAVNLYARQTTSFLLADQCDLGLELEGSHLEMLDDEEGDMLMITKKGEAILVQFKMDGRSVSGIVLTRVDQEGVFGGRSSCMVGLGNRKLFVGSMEGDSRVISWRRKGERVKVTDSVKEEIAEEDAGDEYAFDDLDDLYGNSGSGAVTAVNSAFGAKAKGEYVFQVHDRLVNYGPFRDITFGKPAFPEDLAKRQKGNVSELEAVVTSGGAHPEDAGFTILRNHLSPQVIGRFDFPECQAMWTIRTRPAPKEGSIEADADTLTDEYDRFLIASKGEESLVFRVGDFFQEVTGTEFDPSALTVEASVLREGRRIIQCCETDIRCYDCDFQLIQILAVSDGLITDGMAEPTIISASFADPFVLVVLDNGSVIIYQCDEQTLELEAITVSEHVKTSKYTSGSLYKAKPGQFLPVNDDEERSQDHLCLLLSEAGTLEIHDLKTIHTNKAFFTTNNLPYLPKFLASSEKVVPSKPELKRQIDEVVMADLGDAVHKEPYLILRSSRDDIIMYKPYLFRKHLRFVKSSNSRVPLTSMEGVPLKQETEPGKKRIRPLKVLDDLRGYSAVFMPGNAPALVLKTAQSVPKLYPLSGPPVSSMTLFHTASADHGFIYIDSMDTVRVCLLPDFNYDNNWSAKKIQTKAQVHALAYYSPMNVYVVGTSKPTPFAGVTEGEVPAPADPSILLPMAATGSLHLYSPLTWTSVDSYEFSPIEVPMVIKCVDLEVSEQTKARKQLLAVGTGICKGEDVAARGCIYVFEVVEVVPEPGRPETNRKLKLIVKEEVKGVVSALCGINGFLLAVQGQKTMVRGLKEDNSLLPVAFMDMNMYVSVAKSLDSMVLFGDFMKGISLVGFSEEPYKMTMFGKDIENMSVMTADFLPDESQLFFLVADSENNIHVLQFAPEDAKTFLGTRLMRKASFATGLEISTLTMLPRTRHPTSPFFPKVDQTRAPPNPEYLVLATTLSGSLAMVTTIPESSYRRLNIVQSQIINGEEHAAGLNPKAFRSSTARQLEVGMRGVLDGGFLRRFVDLSEVRKNEIAGKARCEEADVRAELAEIEASVGYL